MGGWGVSVFNIMYKHEVWGWQWFVCVWGSGEGEEGTVNKPYVWFSIFRG